MKNRVEVSVVGATNTSIAAPNMTVRAPKKAVKFRKRPVRKIKETKKKERNLVLEILQDYCSTSTLHGISYLGAKDKSRVEKIWWFIMFVLSVSACSYLINEAWIKWKENPVILSFENEQIPIWQIPFPAVTICPVNKIVQTSYNYTHYFRNRVKLNKEEHKLFSDLSLICNLDQYGPVFRSKIKFTDESVVTSIRKNAPRDTIAAIQWQHLFIDKTWFAEQITEDGLCFSFNSLSQEDMYTDQINNKTNYINHNVTNNVWNIEDGYFAEANRSAYPFRTARDGKKAGLTFIPYTVEFRNDFVCGVPISGYKVIIHSPAETPKAADQYFLIPSNKKVSIIVRPELTKTDKNVRSLTPHTRKCFFSNEKYLRFFKVYTQKNCQTECTANITQEYCGCVPFYMPRDENTRICGYRKQTCIRDMKSVVLDLQLLNRQQLLYLMDEPDGNLEKALARVIKVFLSCDCLPSCFSLQYTAEASQTGIHMAKTYSVSGVGKLKFSAMEWKFIETGLVTASQIDIFFKESQFLALYRSELYGQTDFFANCGGFLGLFMGFSLLSLLEIVYFLTLRLWFKYKNKRQTDKKNIILPTK